MKKYIILYKCTHILSNLDEMFESKYAIATEQNLHEEVMRIKNMLLFKKIDGIYELSELPGEMLKVLL